ncbi:MAG: ClbS/DfsB family four-helix bundle protein [Bryobacterales bacterium]|nr:ClbS/DfsB family four-helix bundle protein [Bryobacterales bacterium]
MPIARTKAELIQAMEAEHKCLTDALAALTGADFQRPGACHHWSCKDILAHLTAWKQMFLAWYAAGLRGENPRTPAADLNWTQTPALNARIYEQWKDVPLDAVRREFDDAYAQLLALARQLPESHLFRKQLYPWMRTWPLARWIAANTSSHYRWARVRIKRWAKTKPSSIDGS